MGVKTMGPRNSGDHDAAQDRCSHSCGNHEPRLGFDPGASRQSASTREVSVASRGKNQAYPCSGASARDLATLGGGGLRGRGRYSFESQYWLGFDGAGGAEKKADPWGKTKAG